MKNISLQWNINFDNEEKEINDFELFSLKITDSLYKKTLVKEKITVNRDAITGNKLNHNCEVVIFESIGRKLVLFLILICNQKTDNG